MLYRQELYMSARCGVDDMSDRLAVQLGGLDVPAMITYEEDGAIPGVAIMIDEAEGLFLWKDGVKQLVEELQKALKTFEDAEKERSEARKAGTAKRTINRALRRKVPKR